MLRERERERERERQRERERERADWFTFIVFYLSRGCLRSVSFHHGAMGWPVVCDCGIPLSYSLIFVTILILRVLKTNVCVLTFSSHFHIFSLWGFYISTSSQFKCIEN